MRFRILLAALAATVAAPAFAQTPTLSVEAGGASAAVTFNVEVTVAGPVSLRAGIGTFPGLGVRLAAPVGLRYTAGLGGPLAVEVGTGVLVTSLSSEYLFSWVTDTEPTPSVQAFPTAEAALRIGVGPSQFIRVGGGAIYDGYDPARRVKVVPSLGAGVAL